MASNAVKRERFKICEKFEAIVSSGKMKWFPCDWKQLDSWGREILSKWADIGVTKFEIGETIIDGVYCIKMDNEMVQYIDIDPKYQLFNECYNDHHDNYHPDQVIAYLLSKKMGQPFRSLVYDDGTSVIQGPDFTCVDTRRRKR